MKKSYTKPQIVFESFVLSTNIAGDCEVKTHVPNNTTCGYKPEGLNYKIFIATISECAAEGNMVVDDDAANGFCYHVPIESNTLFNS